MPKQEPTYDFWAKWRGFKESAKRSRPEPFPPSGPEREMRRVLGPASMSGKRILLHDLGKTWASFTIPNEVFSLLGYKSSMGVGEGRAKRRALRILGLGAQAALTAAGLALHTATSAIVLKIGSALEGSEEETNVEVEFYEEEVYERIQEETEEGLQVTLEQRKHFIQRVVTRRDRPPSAPGEPWVSQTGEALRSIDYQVTVTDQKGEFVRGRIGSSKDYVRWLELGKGRLDPRPTIRPAILNQKGQFMETLVSKS